MQTNQPSLARRPDWFLIALGGDMVLKLSDSLDIGEDATGDLVLNPSNSASLVRVSISDNELSLRARALNMTLSQAGLASLQHLSFQRPDTVQLDFPNNTVIIASDFTHGESEDVHHQVSFIPTSAPTVALERLQEPVILLEEPHYPTAEQHPADPEEPLPEDIMELITDTGLDLAELIPGYESDVPDEQEPADPIDLTSTTHPVPADLPIHPFVGSAEVPASSEGRQRNRLPAIRRVLALMIIAIALVVPLQWDESGLGISEITSAAFRELSSFLDEPNQTADPVRAPDSSDPSGITPVEPTSTLVPNVPTEPPGAESEQPPERQPELESDTAAETTRELLLLEAEVLYNSGSIVTPIERNAVKTLTEVLTADPQNERALRLMYLCASQLLDQARSAYAAGDYFAARNLVEEVVGFHPELAEARALLESWSEVEDL